MLVNVLIALATVEARGRGGGARLVAGHRLSRHAGPRQNGARTATFDVKRLAD